MNKEPTKFYTSLDLELNQDPTTGPKIIQIGAAIGNIESGEVVDSLSIFVNPKQQLIPFITQLTRITQEQVDNGVTITQAYRQLVKFHKQHDSFVNPVTWGGGDVEAIKKEVNEEKDLTEVFGWPFGRRWIDAKTLYCAWRIANGQFPAGGLKKSLRNLGLNFKGAAHDAKDDAVNTFYIFKKLVDLYRGGK